MALLLFLIGLYISILTICISIINIKNANFAPLSTAITLATGIFMTIICLIRLLKLM